MTPPIKIKNYRGSVKELVEEVTNLPLEQQAEMFGLFAGAYARKGHEASDMGAGGEATHYQFVKGSMRMARSGINGVAAEKRKKEEKLSYPS